MHIQLPKYVVHEHVAGQSTILTIHNQYATYLIGGATLDEVIQSLEAEGVPPVGIRIINMIDTDFDEIYYHNGFEWKLLQAEVNGQPVSYGEAAAYIKSQICGAS